MKKLLLTVVVCCISVLAFSQKGKISQDERVFLQNNWKVATAALKETITNVSEEEWTKRPANGGWSVAECMEHIVLSMPTQINQLKKVMSAEANDSKNLRDKDGFVFSKIIDRGKKFSTRIPPKVGNLSKTELVEAYKLGGKEFLAILNDKNGQFRNHFGPTPFGEADAYQLMILIPGHVMRHLNQIQEVLAELRS